MVDTEACEADRDQLHLAAAEGRIFVTRNRDDYIALTVAFYDARATTPEAFDSYHLDFLAQ